MKEVTSIPIASRTFEALRNLGYNLNSSIADVVDNAVNKQVAAKNITVNFSFERKKRIMCYIQDDGCGMSESELEEAMRLGTDTTYEDKDLGKFGMGMKTASLSHCNTLTVISKRKRSNLSAFRWDIGHIKNNGWTLLKLSQQEIKDLIKATKLNFGDQGTAVIWNDLFWLDNEYKSYNNEGLAQNFYFRTLEKLKLHLGMVYHRYLDGSLGKENQLNIYVNDELIEPWDPFCSDEPNTENINLKKEQKSLKVLGYKNPIYIDAFALPTKEAFSSKAAWERAKGLLSWNDSQGYYIYRANRIIRFGGWHGTRAKDEHYKLARVSIDIDPSLDELFRITVNKAKVEFPELLFQHLKNVINPAVIKISKAKYDKDDEKLVVNNNFRKNGKEISQVTKQLLKTSNIKTQKNTNGKVDIVSVTNPNGQWLSNKLNEFLKYGNSNDFEVISDNLEGKQLWKIVCDNNDKFKVIINASHPFYSHVYRATTNKAVTDALDAFIFSLAFSELYNKNNQNAHLLDTYKLVCSSALEKLIKEKVI